MATKKIYTEGVFSSLMRMFSFGLMRRELNKLKSLETDPEIDTTLDTLKADTDDLELKMKRFCEQNPDHYLCQEKGGKSKVKGVVK